MLLILKLFFFLVQGLKVCFDFIDMAGALHTDQPPKQSFGGEGFIACNLLRENGNAWLFLIRS